MRESSCKNEIEEAALRLASSHILVGMSEDLPKPMRAAARGSEREDLLNDSWLEEKTLSDLGLQKNDIAASVLTLMSKRHQLMTS